MPGNPRSAASRLRRYFAFLISTGVEGSTDLNPTYLRWFLGIPLASWVIAVAAVAILLGWSLLDAIPGVVLVVALVNIGSTVRVLDTQGKEVQRLNSLITAAGESPPPIRSVHEVWRARSASWGYLASLIALAFLALIRYIPGWAVVDLFPTGLLPLYELSLLALTVSIIAVLSQYTSRTAAADARVLSGDLRRYSVEVRSSAQRASEQISNDVAALTTRIIEATTQSARETSTVLANLTGAVRELSESSQAQTELVREAHALATAAMDRVSQAGQRQVQALEEMERSRERQSEAEAARLRPRFAIRLRVQGTLIHHVWLDLYDGGSQATGVVATVTGGQTELTVSFGNVSSRMPRSQDLADVTVFPNDGDIDVALVFADIAGRPYRSRQSFHYSRRVSLIGTTAGWRIEPDDWSWTEPHPDIPVLPGLLAEPTAVLPHGPGERP